MFVSVLLCFICVYQNLNLITQYFLQLSPIVGIIGTRVNRARLIAFGEVIVSISCFLTAAPYFIYGTATHFINDESFLSQLNSNQTNFETCPVSGDSQYDCSNGQGATVWPAVAFLIFGSFARGLGYTVSAIEGNGCLSRQIITSFFKVLLCSWFTLFR